MKQINETIFKEKQEQKRKTKEEVSFYEAVKKLQGYLSENYTKTMADKNKVEQEIISYIKNFINTKNLEVKGLSTSELSQNIYNELNGFSFLSKYLHDKEVEEININAWDCVKIHKIDGKVYDTDESFENPEHAEVIVRKLLNQSKMVIDKSTPLVRGHLEGNIRITAIATPVIDDNIGISASIRIINPRKLGKKDFITNGSATEEMLDLLALFANNGVSIVFGGGTDSGKTTLMAYVLSKVTNEQRIITIENEVREFNLIKKDKNGKTINNVVHMITRTRDDASKSISQLKLLEYSLTFNPNVIVVAEAKSEEAYAAQEAARTGHTVLTTTHSSSASAIHYRLMTLCKQGVDMDSNVLYNLVTEAFPIVLFTMKQKDGSRKIMQIGECVHIGDKDIKILYEYNTSQKKFIKKNGISKNLQSFLFLRGVKEEEIRRFV
jgi:pilus assembly protein CpaF